jgi:hypothetical protein
MDVEAMREQDRRAFADGADHFLVQILLRQIRRQERNQRGACNCIDGLGDFQPILLRLGPARARPADTDHDIEAAVLQVQCMGAALAAIAEHGDAGALEGLLVDILLRIDLHMRSRRVVTRNERVRCARSQRINGR